MTSKGVMPYRCVADDAAEADLFILGAAMFYGPEYVRGVRNARNGWAHWYETGPFPGMYCSEQDARRVLAKEGR